MSKLPRLRRLVPIAEKNGVATQQMQEDWQKLAKAIEAMPEPAGDPAASAATTTHKMAVIIGGATYYLLLSDV